MIKWIKKQKSFAILISYGSSRTVIISKSRYFLSKRLKKELRNTYIPLSKKEINEKIKNILKEDDYKRCCIVGSLRIDKINVEEIG